MPTVSRSSLAMQSPRGADCAHSREPFDAAFRCINERRDISPAAKLVHAHLVTLHRMGRGETQTEIGDALGMSRHQVWRATGELVASGLVVVTRRGQGRPNGYELIGVPADDLDGRASRRPDPGIKTPAWPAPPRARQWEQKKKDERTAIPLSGGQCMGCRGDHPTPQCPRYGYVYNRT